MERATPPTVKILVPVLCLLFGFVWGFVAHMTLSESKIKLAYQQGYDARDAQAYRGLSTISHMVVSQKVSQTEYWLESQTGKRYHTFWCEPLNLEEGWEIDNGVFEKRGDCLSLHMDKAELTIDRTYHEIASR